MTLTLRGAIPCKKNSYRRSVNGRMYKTDEQAADIRALEWQAKAQWCDEPVTHPAITMRFYLPDMRRDRDNLATTVLDVLVNAGVLVNDNVRRCNGRIVIEPAVIDADERVEVEVQW
jgi:Holliday junction resolvase RusA-like endonuclease